MFAAIRHAARVVQAVLREQAKAVTRSGEWPHVRRRHLEEHPACAACGGNKHLQVHHKFPYHLNPELELDPTNLITLCMGPFEDHIRIGHGDDFKAWNPNVEHDAAELLAGAGFYEPRRRAIYERAKAARQYKGA